MTTILGVDAIQRALDALISGDHPAADGQFSPNLVFTGVGGCFTGRATGLDEVLHRFIAVGHLTHGTFGTEVEAVYTGDTSQHVVVTRHWASMNGEPVHGTQALLVTVDGDRICTISLFSRPGPRSGIWD